MTQRLRELVGARLATIALPERDGYMRIEAADGDAALELVGTRLEVARSKHGRVLERRRSERVDSLLEDPEADQAVVRQAEALSGLFVPLVVRERAIGVLAAHDKLGSDRRFSDQDPVRRPAVELRPKALDDFGLAPALERLVEGAANVSVVLVRKDGTVTEVVEDDGRGFSPEHTSDGIGLEGMRERLDLLDGRLEIESRPQAGATVVAEVPLP